MESMTTKYFKQLMNEMRKELDAWRLKHYKNTSPQKLAEITN